MNRTKLQLAKKSDNTKYEVQYEVQFAKKYNNMIAREAGKNQNSENELVCQSLILI